MHSTILLAFALATRVLSDVTITTVTQISSGQIQTHTSAESSTTWALPSDYSSTTDYMTMTNSWGVVTGMPSVWTSQPSVITSQPEAVTSQPPAATWSITTGWNTTTLLTTSSSVSTTTFSSTTMSSETTTAPSTTVLVAPAQSSFNAAAVNRVAGAGAALAVLGSLFSLL